MTKIMKIKPLAQACAFILATGSLVGVGGVAVAAPTPADTIIKNKVVVTYQDANGKEFIDESNEIEISIREVRTATLTGSMDDKPMSISAKKAMSVHKLTNTGNIDDIYKLEASNAADDTMDATKVEVYLDKDGNGTLSAEELAAGPLSEIKLGMTESVSLIMVAELPDVIAGGAKLHLMLAAKDSKDIAVKPSYVKMTFSDGTKPPTGPVTIWEGRDGGNCHGYTVVKGAFLQKDALTEASKLKYKGKMGHLMTITSAKEDAFITQYQKDSSVGWTWLGLTKETSTSQWAWGTGEVFDYKNFDTKYENRGFLYSLKHPTSYLSKWVDNPSNSSTDIARNVVVEFDIPCVAAPQPEINLTLKAAKSNCETGQLIAGQTFGDTRLEDMASGECVTMHMRAENTKDVVGEKVKFKQQVPEYASYIANSIRVCGWSEDCKPTARTDSYDKETGNGDWAHYKADEDEVIIGGASTGNFASMKKGVIHAEYRLKID
jgi:hypothetical protein